MMTKRHGLDSVTVAAVLLTILILGALGYGVFSYINGRQATVTVLGTHTDTENGNTQYIVVGTNGVDYQVDSVFWKPFDQSTNPDTNFAMIQANQTYCFTYAGWYLPSWPVYWYYIVYGVKSGSC